MTIGVIPPELPRAADSFYDAGVGMVGGPVPDFSPNFTPPPSDLVVVPRTSAQLAGVPSTADISMAMGFMFADAADPTLLYRVNAAGTKYVAIGGGQLGYVAPPNDGVTDAMPSIQAAVDSVHAAGGGDVFIGPSKANVPFVAGSTVFVPADVNVSGVGVGVTMFTVAAHFPLASVYSRVKVSSSPEAWANGINPCEQRALFYILPTAPFDPTGLVLTTAGYQRVPEISNLTALGNKTQQDGPVSMCYAPQGKSDPNWAFVSGAYSVNQVTNPGQGTIDFSADAQAYTAWDVHDIEYYSGSGTGFYAGPDRQRAKIGKSVNCQQSGTFSGNTIVNDARGYEILGNDAVIIGGSGFGNNTSPVQGSGQSGHLVAGANLYPQKGPSAYKVFQNQDTNGASISNSVLNGGMVSQTASGNANARKGVIVSGCDFNMSQVLVTSGQPSGTIPSVPDEAHNAYAYFSGYRQCVVGATIFSVDQNSKSFLHHVSAVNGSGVMYTGVASSETNVQSWVTHPCFTDNTLGSISYMLHDGGAATPTTRRGLHWKGLVRGANIATTQYITEETPVVFQGGILGGPGGTAPQVGYVDERIAINGTSAGLTNGAQSNLASGVIAPGEYDIYAAVQFATGATTVAAATATFEISISTTSATLDASSARTYAGQFLPIPAGGASGVPLTHMLIGPLVVSVAANTTHYLVIRGSNLSTNTITASGVLYGRRRLAG